MGLHEAGLTVPLSRFPRAVSPMLRSSNAKDRSVQTAAVETACKHTASVHKTSQPSGRVHGASLRAQTTCLRLCIDVLSIVAIRQALFPLLISTSITHGAWLAITSTLGLASHQTLPFTKRLVASMFYRICGLCRYLMGQNRGLSMPYCLSLGFPNILQRRRRAFHPPLFLRPMIPSLMLHFSIINFLISPVVHRGARRKG